MDEETNLEYCRFIVISGDGNMSSRHATQAAAIEDAQREAGYGSEPYYVAHVIGVARPLAQPSEYVRLPAKKAKVTKKRRTSHDRSKP